jgi:hypothetical protein
VNSQDHDIVAFPSGHVAAIPAQIPDDAKNQIASDIHNALQSAAGSSYDVRHVLPSGERVGKMTSTESDADVAREAKHPVLRDVMHGTGEALGDVWDTVKGTPAGIYHSLPPIALVDSVKQALPVIHTYESARNAGKSVHESLTTANEYSKNHDALKQAIQDRIQEFKDSPVKAGVRTTGDVAAFIASLGLGGGEAAGAEGTEAGAAIPKIVPRSKVIPIKVAPVAPMSETERAAEAFARRQYGNEEPDVEVQGLSDDPAINLGGKTERSALAGKARIEGVTPDAEAQELARQVLNNHAKTVAEANDPVQQLAQIRQRLGIKTGKPSPEAIGASSVKDVTPEAVSAIKSRLAAKEQANAATLESHTTGDPDVLSKHTIAAKNDGKIVGSLRLTEEPQTGVVRVDNAASELQEGSGLGTRMYRRAIDEAAARNPQGTFVSDGVVAKPAQNVWRKLKSLGYPVVETEGKGGSTFSIKLSDLKKSAVAPTPPVTPDWAKSLVKKPAQSAPPKPFMSEVGGMVHRAMEPKAIDITSEIPD